MVAKKSKERNKRVKHITRYLINYIYVMNIIYDKVTYFKRPLAKNLLCEFLGKAVHFYNTICLLVLVDQRLQTILLAKYPSVIFSITM